MKFFIIFLFIVCFGNIYAKDELQTEKKQNQYNNISTDRILVRVKSGYNLTNHKSIFRISGIIDYKQILPNSSSITYNKSIDNNLSLSIDKVRVLEVEEKLLRTFVIFYDGKISPEEYCKQIISTNPAIEIAEPYYLPEFLSFLPNDPLIEFQDDFLKLIQAYEAWEIEKGDPSVTIGISDSGTNQEHEDIADNLAININEIPNDGIDNDGNGYIDDYKGYNFAWQSTAESPGDTYNASILHGQQVAGIAGASTNNSLGIAGIGYNSTLLPIKIVEGSSLKYAYESIVFAAVRGIKVLNCSWGVVKPFSEIDQSIIDYAVSRDVAIVAAAGNTSSKFTKFDVFYPAAYYGVLGVGEVTSIDRLSSTSSISVGCRILAPGDDNYTTTNNGYFTCDGGTSFASPVVAGAVALARSKYPQLSAVQSLEFVRQAVDKHNNFSSTNKELIPGRINLLKSVTMDPFSIPGILPEKYTYFDANNEETDRFKMGDLVNLNITAKNVLGSASNLVFTLSIAYDPANSVEILNNSFEKDYIASGDQFSINSFKMKVLQNYSGFVILRVDISGENGYKDFFKFNFVPAKDISTFSNDKIKFSLSDNGEFGFSTSGATVTGIGFSYDKFGNQIYRNSSIMFSENNSKVIYNSSISKFYGFTTVKGFVAPDRNLAIYNDNNAGNQRVGIEISQNVVFPKIDSKAVRFDFKILNTGANNINNASFGLYIDWDVSSEPSKNQSKLLQAAIPNDYWGTKAVAQAVYTDGNYPMFGSAAYSIDPNTEAQSAGLNSEYNSNFDNAFRLASLNSGMAIQSSEKSDFGTVVGIKFLGNWLPNETKLCSICVGAGDNEADLAKSLKECLFGVTSFKENLSQFDKVFTINPNPASEYITIQIQPSDGYQVHIFNTLGIEVSSAGGGFNEVDGGGYRIDISHLPAGVYFIRIGDRVEKFVKM